MVFLISLFWTDYDIKIAIMNVIKILKNNYEEVIDEAASIIKDGGLIIYPTETFYGIGARYDDEKAIKKIYDIKIRSDNKTIPLILASQLQLEMIVSSISCIEERLINLFWPGPLTILFNAREDLNRNIISNGKVAARMPSNDIALNICEKSGLPITSTSANISNSPPSNRVEPLIEEFNNKVDLIIDGGITKGGSPSTIVECLKEEIRILRDGAIKIEDLTKAGFKICLKKEI
ncbi:MAG: L-threonylcarbamoyladenylate synthase [Thermodesulfovibrionales bacterium]|nr:L-threonylcarbamoyladenylate synthase [Thermodesulfovibrionales bacterium]